MPPSQHTCHYVDNLVAPEVTLTLDGGVGGGYGVTPSEEFGDRKLPNLSTSEAAIFMAPCHGLSVTQGVAKYITSPL